MEQALLDFVNDELLAGEDRVIGPTDEFVLDGTVDSLGVARLIAYAEAEYMVTIPADDVTIENFRNIVALCDYLRDRLDAESAA